MKRTTTTLAVLGIAVVALLPVRPAAGLAPPSPPSPPEEVDACATTWTGRRLACVSVLRDGVRDSQATVCTYDDALGILDWSRDDEVACVEVGERWGFVEGPAACVRLIANDQPAACANGEDGCVLWVAGFYVLCHA